MKYYAVGGYVRDHVLGKKSKDLDFVVINSTYQDMKDYLEKNNCEIFQEREQYGTIRCFHPEYGAADFVLARKDGDYSDGRRPDSCSFGVDLLDDLSRRDFTMNAMAMDMATGELVDPYNGQEDLKLGQLRTVGTPRERFAEDGLRVLRALRFALTKGLQYEEELEEFLTSFDPSLYLHGVSEHRIFDELKKMFSFSTYNTIQMISELPCLESYLFQHRNIKLEPRLKGSQ